MQHYAVKQLARYAVLEGQDAQVLKPEDKLLATELANLISQKLLDLGASELNYRIARHRDGSTQYVAYSAVHGLREWFQATGQWSEMRLNTMLDIVQDLLVNH